MGTSSYPRMRSGDDHTGTTCGGERSHCSFSGTPVIESHRWCTGFRATEGLATGAAAPAFQEDSMVKRYGHPFDDEGNEGTIEEQTDGKFVLYADYEAVVAERDALKEKVDFVARELRTISYMVTREEAKV